VQVKFDELYSWSPNKHEPVKNKWIYVYRKVNWGYTLDVEVWADEKGRYHTTPLGSKQTPTDNRTAGKPWREFIKLDCDHNYAFVLTRLMVPLERIDKFPGLLQGSVIYETRIDERKVSEFLEVGIGNKGVLVVLTDPYSYVEFLHNAYIRVLNTLEAWNPPYNMESHLTAVLADLLDQARKSRDFDRHLNHDPNKLSYKGWLFRYQLGQRDLAESVRDAALRVTRALNSDETQNTWNDYHLAKAVKRAQEDYDHAKLDDKVASRNWYAGVIFRLNESIPGRQYLRWAYANRKTVRTYLTGISVAGKNTKSLFKIAEQFAAVLTGPKHKAVEVIKTLLFDHVEFNVKTKIFEWKGKTTKEIVYYEINVPKSKFPLADGITKSNITGAIRGVIEVFNIAWGVYQIVNGNSATAKTSGWLTTSAGLASFLSIFKNRLGALGFRGAALTSKLLGPIGGGLSVVTSGVSAFGNFRKGNAAAGTGDVITATGGGLLVAAAFSTSTFFGAPAGVVLVIAGGILTAVGSVISFYWGTDSMNDWIRHCTFGCDYGDSGPLTANGKTFEFVKFRGNTQYQLDALGAIIAESNKP